MKIQGASGAGAEMWAGQVGMGASADDPISQDIQRQIADIQKQLQELPAKDDMSAEAKAKKRQELQKQLNELNMQLRQHQMEQKRKKQQEQSSSFDDMLGQDEAMGSSKADGKGAELSLSGAGMEAMISADVSKKQAHVQGSVATRMEGRADVLGIEIKLDSARNGNVERKQAELADAEQKAANATASQIKTLAEAGRAVKEAESVGADRRTGAESKGDSGEEDSEKRADGKREEEDAQSAIYYRPVDIRL